MNIRFLKTTLALTIGFSFSAFSITPVLTEPFAISAEAATTI